MFAVACNTGEDITVIWFLKKTLEGRNPFPGLIIAIRQMERHFKGGAVPQDPLGPAPPIMQQSLGPLALRLSTSIPVFLCKMAIDPPHTRMDGAEGLTKWPEF